MIELYFWPTPNGYKPLIALEELGLPYVIRPVDITKGDQFSAAFLAIAPNNRIPAIIDDASGAGGSHMTLFESGAILTYLAEQGEALAVSDRTAWFEVQQWLHWQMGGLGPTLGQAGHFHLFADEDIPYAKARFLKEAERLIGVMEYRLRDRNYLAGRYSIADIACYPWLRLHAMLPLSLAPFPRVLAWMEAIADRPAVRRAYEVGGPAREVPILDASSRAVLFGHQGSVSPTGMTCARPSGTLEHGQIHEPVSLF